MSVRKLLNMVNPSKSAKSDKINGPEKNNTASVDENNNQGASDSETTKPSEAEPDSIEVTNDNGKNVTEVIEEFEKSPGQPGNKVISDKKTKSEVLPEPVKSLLNVIAFYKQTVDSPWTLFPQAFLSEEQAITKLDITSNPNEVHFVTIDFPE